MPVLVNRRSSKPWAAVALLTGVKVKWFFDEHLDVVPDRGGRKESMHREVERQHIGIAHIQCIAFYRKAQSRAFESYKTHGRGAGKVGAYFYSVFSTFIYDKSSYQILPPNHIFPHLARGAPLRKLLTPPLPPKKPQQRSKSSQEPANLAV